MQIVYTVAELRAVLDNWRCSDDKIAFVPTMGDLHDGHLSLIRKAKQLANKVVVSIFVNPLQFGENEDFDSYPQLLEHDGEKLQEHNIDLLFAPTLAAMYPDGLKSLTQVAVTTIGDTLCGASRPGHFNGVATVVSKFFNMVQPDIALFGEKDYQQLLVIRKLTKDLCFPIEIIAVETCREVDGLAMSSRNRYLSESQRDLAPTLYRELRKAKKLIESGTVKDFSKLSDLVCENLSNNGFIPDYFEVRSADNLTKPDVGDDDLFIFAAAWLGKARLIDNIRVYRGEK